MIRKPLRHIRPNHGHEKVGQTYYYQFNAHGDVVSLTDSSGLIVNTYSYDPWGNPLTASETVENPYRYAGYRSDENTGLYYLRARYYVPGIGRFLTRDNMLTARDPKTNNRYAYVFDNPVNIVDLTGLLPASISSAWDSVSEGWDYLASGEYVGTGYGQQAVDWYAERWVETGKWYYAFGGGMASLWTPDSWWKTTLTLGVGYTWRVIGPYNPKAFPRVPPYVERIRRYIRYDRPHHGQPPGWDGDWFRGQ